MWRISVAIDEGAVKYGPLIVTPSIVRLRVKPEVEACEIVLSPLS